MLYERGCTTYVFDGDNVRDGLCSDLGFGPEDRTENIRRVGEMVKLFVDAGIIALTAFISPYRRDRERIRELIGPNRFFEVHVKCPVDVCASRDPKGIYAKARAGIIKEFAGISAPHEAPEHADLVIRSEREDPVNAARRILELIEQMGII